VFHKKEKRKHARKRVVVDGFTKPSGAAPENYVSLVLHPVKIRMLSVS